MQTLFESTLHSLPLLHRGKVRDIYQLDDEHLLIITTDRLSAFDVVFPTPIPEKGKILNQMSCFWFKKLSHIIKNHLTDIVPESVVAPDERSQVSKRAVVVKRYQPLPIEAVVRGYLAGSGWKEYQKMGRICGILLPLHLLQSEKLPYPLFTPSTKAPNGEHDQNIDFSKVTQTIGTTLAQKVKSISLQLYQEATEYALSHHILIADTKFEFGTDEKGELYWIDEAFTPDSSRFWQKESYQIGTSPDSLDKQLIRNWLETMKWDKKPPAPSLPESLVIEAAEKYQQVWNKLNPVCT